MIKKIAILGVFAMALGLSACKKDYTCTCTSGDGMGNVATSTVVLENTTRDEAETACNASVSVGGASASCTLD